jgi:tetratricopeptide (TPR) repeat protein
MSATCWTCGEATPTFTFRCVQCEQLLALRGIDNSISIVGGQVDTQLRAITQATNSASSALTEISGNVEGLLQVEAMGNMLEVAQLNALRELSKKIPEALGRIESTVRWSCEQVVWRIEQQTDVIRGIDESLKTPAQTKANEWRIMADTLRERGVLNEACSFYEKSVAENPLDYRTYVGLATAHIQNGNHEQALKVLEGSLPHAPRGESDEITDWRSHSLRTMAHVYHCLGNHDRELEVLREALKYSPDYRACRYDHAVAAMECKCDEESIASLAILLHRSEMYFELTRRHIVFINNASKVKPILKSALNQWADKLVHSPLTALNAELTHFIEEFGFFTGSMHPADLKAMRFKLDAFEADINSTMKKAESIKNTLELDDLKKIWQAASSTEEIQKDVIFASFSNRLLLLRSEAQSLRNLRQTERFLLIMLGSMIFAFLILVAISRSLRRP